MGGSFVRWYVTVTFVQPTSVLVTIVCLTGSCNQVYFKQTRSSFLRLVQTSLKLVLFDLNPIVSNLYTSFYQCVGNSLIIAREVQVYVS